MHGWAFKLKFRFDDCGKQSSSFLEDLKITNEQTGSTCPLNE